MAPNSCGSRLVEGPHPLVASEQSTLAKFSRDDSPQLLPNQAVTASPTLRHCSSGDVSGRVVAAVVVIVVLFQVTNRSIWFSHSLLHAFVDGESPWSSPASS